MKCKFCGQEMEDTKIGEHYNYMDCAYALRARVEELEHSLHDQIVEDNERIVSRNERILALEAEITALKSEIVSKDKKLTDYEKELRQLQSDWQDVPRVSVRRTYWMPFKTSWAAPAVNKRYLVKLRNDWICIATYYLRVGGGYWKDDRGQELTDGVVEFWKGLDE